MRNGPQEEEEEDAIKELEQKNGKEKEKAMHTGKSMSHGGN